MKHTLVILKPGAIQRGLVGEIIKRFEQKGLQICGMKMMQLTHELLNEHYAHLAEKPYFGAIKESMMSIPVVVCCIYGKDAVEVVRNMAGETNGRRAAFGTIRGDLCNSIQHNVIHTSDSPETAAIEIKRFFKDEEIFNYKLANLEYTYSAEEIRKDLL